MEKFFRNPNVLLYRCSKRKSQVPRHKLSPPRDLLRLKFSQEDEEEYELSDEEYEQDPPASNIMKQVFLFPSKRFKFSFKFC
jgi:hypothetical protein